MFLYKRGSRYYLSFLNEEGKKIRLSTGRKSKSEAIEFLRRFRLEEHLKKFKEDGNLLNKTILVRCTDEFLTKDRKNRLLPINTSLGLIVDRRREVSEWERVFESKSRRFNAEVVSKGFKQLARTAGLNERVI
jgi:hypothetical protein